MAHEAAPEVQCVGKVKHMSKRDARREARVRCGQGFPWRTGSRRTCVRTAAGGTSATVRCQASAGVMDLLERAFPYGADERVSRNEQCAHGGRRTDRPLVYESTELRVRSEMGSYPVVRVYVTDGPGADDEAIRQFHKSGSLDYRCEPG